VISDCDLRKDGLYHKGEKIDLNNYNGVIKRTWDGGKNAAKGADIQQYLETQGLYAETPSIAQRITLNKVHMQLVMDDQGVKTPKTVIYDFTHSPYDETTALTNFNKLPREAGKPVAVLKQQTGTQGNGIAFYHSQEEVFTALRGAATAKQTVLMQEYISPTLRIKSETNTDRNAAHYRIIMSRNKETGNYQCLGGLYLQRNGAYISNSSYKGEGILHTEALPTETLSLHLLRDLAKTGRKIGIHQFGADVMINDKGAFILELNDGFGISGPLLEKQKIPEKYVDSFLERYQERYKFRHKFHQQLALNESFAQSRL